MSGGGGGQTSNTYKTVVKLQKGLAKESQGSEGAPLRKKLVIWCDLSFGRRDTNLTVSFQLGWRDLYMLTSEAPPVPAEVGKASHLGRFDARGCSESHFCSSPQREAPAPVCLLSV